MAAGGEFKKSHTQARLRPGTYKLATTVAYTMAVEAPAELEGSAEEDYDMDGSDVDAEGEEDEEFELANEEQPPDSIRDSANEADGEDDKGEGEGEDEDELEDGEESGDDFVGAVKVPTSRKPERDEEAAFVEDSDANAKDSSAEEEEDKSDKFSSDEDSAAEEQWEGTSQAEEIEAEVATRNNCM